MKMMNINMNEAYEALMPDYWAGLLSPEDHAAVSAYLAARPVLQQEEAGHQQVWNGLTAWESEKPSPALTQRFEAMLAAYDAALRPQPVVLQADWKSRWASVWNFRPALSWGWQVAIGMGCLLLGLWVGRTYWMRPSDRQDVAEIRRELDELNQKVTMAWLQQASASDRLAAIDRLRQVSQPAPETFQLLIKTLSDDPNVNVRIAAAEALLPYLHQNPGMLEQVKQSFESQDSPIVQSVLIEMLVQMKEKSSVRLLEEVRNTTNEPTLRRQIEESLPQLKTAH